MGTKRESLITLVKSLEEEGSSSHLERTRLLSEVNGLIFGLSEKGPVLVFQHVNSTLNELDILRIGAYFYPAIGQGDNRNRGLYKLPVPGYQDLHAFVYTHQVLDPGYTDPRCKGQNYCLVIIIFPKKARKYFLHPLDLEIVFQKTLSSYKSMEELKTSKLFSILIPKLVVKGGKHDQENDR